MINDLYAGLVHHPVYNKFGEVVTTSITNLDIHDISRSCFTFGVKKFFVITPLPTQKELLEKILKFWQSDIASCYNKDRVNALSIIEYAKDIEIAKEIINSQGGDCLIVTTTATELKNQLNYDEFVKLEKPVFLLFGTGNGLTRDVHEKADFILKPIHGNRNYNHLSVRSAVAIVLDRITSEK